MLEVDLAKQEKQSQKDLEEHLASEDCISIAVFLLIVDLLDGSKHSTATALLHISVTKAALAANH